MQIEKHGDKSVSVKSIPEGGSVLLYLGDGRRVQVERAYDGFSLSIKFDKGATPVVVYDQHGEEIGLLKGPRYEHDE